MNDFLLRGFDIPFLTEENDGISNVFKPDPATRADTRNDIRKAIITYLQSR